MPTPTTSSTAIRFNMVAGQVSGAEIPALSDDEIAIMLDRSVSICGDRPAMEDDPSEEQLAVLHFLVLHGKSTYIGFAIWGLYHERLVKQFART